MKLYTCAAVVRDTDKADIKQNALLSVTGENSLKEEYPIHMYLLDGKTSEDILSKVVTATTSLLAAAEQYEANKDLKSLDDEAWTARMAQLKASI